jgi:hypothetical protein
MSQAEPGTCPPKMSVLTVHPARTQSEVDSCRSRGTEAGTDAYNRSEMDALRSSVAPPSMDSAAAPDVEDCIPGAAANFLQ